MMKTGRGQAFLCMLIVITIMLPLLLPGCGVKPAAVENTSYLKPLTTEKTASSKYVQAINLGAEWFLNNETSEFIGYEYDIKKESYTDSSNALRQMASMWAIARMYKFTGDERYKALAEKGLGYFRQYFKYDIANDFYYINITPDSIKLSYPAFVILTMLELDTEGKDIDLERLSRGIIFQQRTDGSLKTLFYSDQEAGVDYYPGEALLAIISMYEYTRDDKYLAVMDKAYPYYMRYYYATKVPAFVPWHTRAYTKYVNATGNKQVAGWVLYMNDFITAYFQPENCSKYKFKGISSAVYLESMVQAYGLAQKYGDDQRLSCYRNFIDECSDFVLSLQLTNEQAYPGQAIGGFLSSPTSSILRCDNTQHAIMSLMDAYGAGLVK